MSGLTISGHVVESAPRSISTVDTKKDRRKSNRKYRYSNVFELAGNNDTEALSELLEINGKIASLSSPQFATTPLHHASAHGSINTILLLLQHEADINSKDATGATPLHFACINNRPETCKLLIEKGAMLNVRDNSGATPLHKAVMNEFRDVIRLLLDHNAKLKRDKNHLTPLHVACFKANIDNLKMLLNAQLCTKKILNRRSKTDESSALHIACTAGFTEGVKELCKTNGVKLSLRDHNDQTPLHSCCAQGHLEALKVMLQHRVSVTCVDKIGRTPLHIASFYGFSTIVSYLLDETGSQVDQVDDKGRTALHLAAIRGHVEAANILIHHGADVLKKDNGGKEPIDLAVKASEFRTAQLLARSGADFNKLYQMPVKYIERRERLAEHKIVHVDCFGFAASDTESANGKAADGNLTKKEIRQLDAFLNKFSKLKKADRTKLRKLLAKGIPNKYRAKLWTLCTQLEDTSREAQRRNVDYQELVNGNLDRVHAQQIDNDVDRTWRNHALFAERFGKGQRALYNVLKSYAIYDAEVGYCQGMSAIVALLLLYFSEEESFWILVKVLEDWQMREYYKPGMVGLTKSFKVLEELLLKKSPSVYQKLNEDEIQLSSFVPRWFMTVYGGSIPLSIRLSLWDLIFFDGPHVVFSTAVGLLDLHKDEILSSPSEDCLRLLQDYNQTTPELQFQNFVKNTVKFNIKPKDINKIERKLGMA
jgi:ankyrin repeat protein